MNYLTVKYALAGAVLLPLLVCKALMARMLLYLPLRGAVTFTVSLQEPLAGIERPAGKVTVFTPVVTTPLPPQVVLTVGVDAITTPLGNVSVSGAVRLAAVLLEFFKIMVRVDTPPALIVFELKALLSVGAIATVKVALAGRVLLPLLVCNAPAGSVLT